MPRRTEEDLGRLSRQKGQRWERVICTLLREIFPTEIYRGHQHISGGVNKGEGCDCEGSPFWVEGKHQKLSNPRAALLQSLKAQEKKRDSRLAVAICKDDRRPAGWHVGIPLDPATVTMTLSDWSILVEDWVRLKQAQKEPLELERRPNREGSVLNEPIARSYASDEE